MIKNIKQKQDNMWTTTTTFGDIPFTTFMKKITNLLIIKLKLKEELRN